jgi:hypothetical protein
LIEKFPLSHSDGINQWWQKDVTAEAKYL